MRNVTLVNHKAVHYAALAGLLSLALLATATAAEFSGSLKGVSITDEQVTNNPPTAAFTYKQDLETITFDASGSSDADGSITKYKWDFGNGTTSEGATVAYTLIDTASLKVTLTVVDNNNGVALSQQAITPAGIVDDFSKDTSANYSKAYGAGTLAITGGYAHLSATYSNRNIFYHTTSLGSADQYIKCNVDMPSTSDQSGVAFRVDPSNHTAYVAYFDKATFKFFIRGFNLSSGAWTGATLSSVNTYSEGPHLITVSIKGNNITATVDGVAAIRGTQTIYATGNYAGLVFYRGPGDPKIYAFKARAN